MEAPLLNQAFAHVGATSDGIEGNHHGGRLDGVENPSQLARLFVATFLGRRLAEEVGKRFESVRSNS